MRERGKLLPSTATSYEDRMAKCLVSTEEKEGRSFVCCFETDGEQEVEVEEAWTRWAFSVYKRAGQSLEIRLDDLTTRGVLARVSLGSMRSNACPVTHACSIRGSGSQMMEPQFLSQI
jgi:hypothetical protein